MDVVDGLEVGLEGGLEVGLEGGLEDGLEGVFGVVDADGGWRCGGGALVDGDGDGGGGGVVGEEEDAIEDEDGVVC